MLSLPKRKPLQKNMEQHTLHLIGRLLVRISLTSRDLLLLLELSQFITSKLRKLIKKRLKI